MTAKIIKADRRVLHELVRRASSPSPERLVNGDEVRDLAAKLRDATATRDGPATITIELA